jgi:hypothetical protein
MALNKNHEFEELNGVKCGIVEKNVKPERVAFLKSILELNGFTVVVVPSPPPKVAPVPKPANTEGVPPPETPNPEPEIKIPETFTVGVTDYTFNSINAIFGRQLKTRNGHFVTLAYWNQEDNSSNDEIPYYEHD